MRSRKNISFIYPFSLSAAVGALVSSLGLAMLLAGCSSNQDIQPTLYSPPTVAVSLSVSSPTSQSLQLPATQAAIPSCSNELKFLTDLSVPDATVVLPGAPVDKRWQVENSGSCNWQSGYTLRLISGPEMGVQPEQALYPARSGTQASIRILFTAPLESGQYRSAWQAYDPAGESFGDVFFIDITVQP